MDFRLVLPLAVTLFGTYLLFKLKFFFILHPVKTSRNILSAVKEGEGVKGLCLALAGTLGVGNIIGVAVGISVGGAGSVLWLLFSSVFATVLKYSESTLGAECSECGHGGMSYVIRNAFLKTGVPLSIIYAVLCLLLAFFMGAALQSASAVECIGESFGISRTMLAPVLIFLLVPALLKGADRIESITAIVIPLSTLIYIFLSLSAIIKGIEHIPEVLSSVVRDAFCPRGAAGGLLGFFSSVAVREGFARGLLSNEAGAGTSAAAHSRANGNAVHAGLFGMCEVFFDTVLLCTLTALAILVTFPCGLPKDPVTLVLGSVGSVFGIASEYLVSLLIFSFAYATVVCWYFYGSECTVFLFGKRPLWFMPLFLFFVAVGCLFSVGSFVLISDLVLLLLTLLSSSAVIKSSDRLVNLSEKSGIIPSRSREKRTLPPR